MKKTVKRSGLGRKLAIGAATVAAVTAGFFLSTAKGKSFFVPGYTVLRVIDGDTFETTEKQLIRLASTEAPELDRCGGADAKAALEKLILNRPLYLKILHRDPYYRLVSLVYTKEKFINQEMIEKGHAYYYNRDKSSGESLKTASDDARAEKRGILGEPCTQERNIQKPSCIIKGNTRDGEKIYFTPDCGLYHRTTVQLYLDDQWFCTEKEAQKAGFRKPSQCP